ncbi:ap-domain-containing protein [Ceraceosorus bombacis]|uniref:Ap-domain-containing protein n=1 Tax=Ceraceosorus bombacis TaxID=401625 RepID=A0A0P1B8F3_9BASI|nr:ap-domain-containing protein [Ceraceosorus bombacis]
MNTKAAAERHARQLVQLLKEPGNDQCADCGGRSPRWASWNLGIFICVQCAGVHRKLGTHITKVKSLTLDTWTREQVDRMKEVGNTRSNAKWNPDEKRNRPPANVEESERHSELERFIVKKYQGVFMERKPPPVPQKDASALRPPPSPFRARSPSPAHSATAPTPAPPSAPSAGPSIERSRTAPIPQHGNVGSSAKPTSPPPALPTRSSGLTVPGGAPPRASSSAALMNNGGHAAAAASPAQFASPSASTSTPTPSSALSTSSRSSVFDDLISLQEGPAQTAQPPLQMNPWAAMQAQAAVYPSSPLGTNGTLLDLMRAAPA